MTQVSAEIYMRRDDFGAYDSWFQNVPWQLFCTLTFAWKVSDAQAEQVFRGFVNRLEKRLRAPVAYLRGDEKRFSGCGKPAAPRHFHALLAAHLKLDRHFVADLWMGLAGRRKNGAGANVRVYDPTLGGLAYVLKFIFEPLGDWDLRNVDLFLTAVDPQRIRSRQRRRLIRQSKRTRSARAGREAVAS